MRSPLLSRAIALVALAATFVLAAESDRPAHSQSLLESRVPHASEITLDFQPPQRGAPSETAGGASRGGCVEEDAALTLLVPNGFGQTTQSHPTFFFYVPQTSAEQATFTLSSLSEDGTVETVHYSQTFEIEEANVVVPFALPSDAPALEAGRDYYWSIDLLCDLENAGENIYSVAWIERVPAPPELESALASDRPSLYAQKGLWYDTLAALLELRSRESGSAEADWINLLENVELGAIADKPVAAIED